MAYIHIVIVIQCISLTWCLYCTPKERTDVQGICKCVKGGIICETSMIILHGQDVDILNYLVGNYSSIESIDVSDYGPGLNISLSLFTKFSQLKYLRVHHCNVVTIATGAFSNLSDLRTLEITGNPSLTYDSITSGLKSFDSPLLYMLNVSGNHNDEVLPLATLRYEMFSHMSNTSLTVLDISWSRLTFIEAPFPLLPHLEVLNMSGTYVIGYGNCFTSLLSLDNISLIAFDYWPKFPRGYDSIVPWGKPSGLYAKRSSEDACIEYEMEVFSEKGCLHKLPEKLTTVIVRNVYLDSIFLNVADMCFEHNNVVNLVSTKSKFSKQLGVFGGLHQLKLFDMSFPDNSDKEFHNSMIKPEMFHDMPSLMTIKIPGFRLYEMAADDFKTLFVRNLNLTHLDISFNDLTIVPFDTFTNNRYIKVLNVSNNKISEFNVNLTNCGGIQMVDLSNNNLKNIDVGVSSGLSSFNSSIEMYVQGNALNCECHLLKFFRSDNILFDHPECLFDNERKTLDDMTLEFVDDVCSNRIHSEVNISTSVIIGVTTSCVVIVLVLVIGVTVWRRKGRKSNSNPDQQSPISVVIPISNTDVHTRNPKFVVFLAYSHRDRDFVVEKIYSNLNKKLKRRLPNRHPEELIILYDKNFIAGSCIDTQCHYAVQNSHVTVAVMTEHFLASPWCELELKLAYESKLPLIPLFVSKCDPDQLTPFLRILYDEKVRLLWPDTANLDAKLEFKATDVMLETMCNHIMAYVERSKKTSGQNAGVVPDSASSLLTESSRGGNCGDFDEEAELLTLRTTSHMAYEDI